MPSILSESQHFIRWRRNVDNTESNILAHNAFQKMLKEGATMLRVNAESDPFAPVLQEGATDAVAFASILRLRLRSVFSMM